jgi:hypothetical protein
MWFCFEQNKLTSDDLACGGAVGQLRSSASITQVLKYSVELQEASMRKQGLPRAGK